MIRTRFAPSPTGYLHVGGARTALFSWAYARKHGGKFVLRIEDTDLERSTETSVNAIIDGMKWLGLDWDEGPFRQMERLARYREVADQLLSIDKAYWCYASKDELEQMRERQRAHGVKPRYDGRWRPENAKSAGLTPPAGVNPVLRFRNPDEGAVTFIDLVKGPITVANSEIDDLVILRADGVPTYNFGVVVDDLDMNITHVIRGDDHVNNTPRQVNIFQALGAPLPQFAHAPMILGADGERLSKRHGAVSVMQYPEDGFLPEALFNYLARLGWSHGDAEKFTREQFVEWFDLAHVSKSTAQFDGAKLAWLNHQYIKEADDARLAELLAPRIERDGGKLIDGPALVEIVKLLKDRANTMENLAEAAMIFYKRIEPSKALVAEHLTPDVLPAVRELAASLERVEWQRPKLNEAVKAVVGKFGVKMPKIAMPLRVMLLGQTQTPSIDAVLELLGRDVVLARMQPYLVES
ncbi:MAG: glutamate--tRNA ligase [Burkholderiales bacterium]|nr:glutamate--tRNA ligase [Burkholderiales bacterium]